MFDGFRILWVSVLNYFSMKILLDGHEKFGEGLCSLNATDMLERLRGKRLAFVGDSLNRNMWESLVCILRHAVEDKGRVFEISGRHDFRTQGFYAFRFEVCCVTFAFLMSVEYVKVACLLDVC